MNITTLMKNDVLNVDNKTWNVGVGNSVNGLISNGAEI